MASINLGEIADIITGPFGSMLHKSDYREAGIPVIMPQDIGDRTLLLDGIARIGQQDAERLARYVTVENDIVYARRGDVEKHAFITADEAGALCGTGCLRVRVDERKADPLFVSFYLNRPESRMWIRLHAVGSNMPNINTDILSGLPMELPDLEVQRKVGTLLRRIDAKIANNEKLMAELEETARLIYDYWFTQFDFPDENGCPYRSSGGKMAWSDELKREIPEGWNASSLSELCGFRNGVNYDKDSMSGSHCRIVNVRNITSSTLFINPSELDEIDLPANLVKRYSLGSNDILIARSGTPGAVRLIDEPTGIIFCGFIICCTPNNSEYRSYLTMALKRLEGTTATVTGGSILKNVSQDTLKNVIVVCPPEAVIEQFNAIIDVMLRQIVRIEKENWKLISLRDWLLPMLMNGQLVVE